ncbi:MAG: fasciclin domain-containing protein [Leptolyngbyaceae cyanobacterium bins.349]|nr:fasciclin domain-containing protein [Leptolyngbyaceae cyanobacterium bins.349]
MASLIETMTQTGKFNTLMQAIKSASLMELLQSPGPMTMLAPTDEAFSRLSEDFLHTLLTDIPALKRVLMYHVVFGDARLEDLKQIDEAPTGEGSIVAVEHTDCRVKVNDATVLESDILTDNGVIHVIDRVLMPAVIEAELEREATPEMG